MYECYYGYIKPIYFHKAKLCYMDTKNDIAEGVQKKIWCNELQQKQIITYKETARLMKDDFGGKIMVQFVALQPKMYSYKA